jgi:transposase IS166 family protein
MVLDPAALPDDVATLKAMLVAASKRDHDLDAEIETLKLTIAKLQHARFGNSSERTSVLMEQLELQLGELVERRAQETAADEIAAAQTATKPDARQQRRMPALARSPCDQNGVGTGHPRTSGANTALNVSAASWWLDSILPWGDGPSPTRSTAGAAFWRARDETEYRD